MNAKYQALYRDLRPHHIAKNDDLRLFKKILWNSFRRKGIEAQHFTLEMHIWDCLDTLDNLDSADILNSHNYVLNFNRPDILGVPDGPF